jgi:small subunit ribosomal protein S21
MAIRVERRHGESNEKFLKRFKKKCEKEDLVKDMKRIEYHESKGVRKRRERRKLMKRIEKESLEIV